MKLLLTGDDIPSSPGSTALLRLAAQCGDSLMVVPARTASFSGHRVTVRRPLALKEQSRAIYTLDGTPVDCVRIGVTSLLPDVDWVLSGLNAGGNLGMEVYSSATVGAAREATLLGRKAIAISHLRERGREVDWGLAIARVSPLIRHLMKRPLEKGVFWNINLPHPRHDEVHLEVAFRPLDTTPIVVEYEKRGNTFQFRRQHHQKPITRGGDVEACLQGKISVTKMGVSDSTFKGLNVPREPYAPDGGAAFGDDGSSSHDTGGAHGGFFAGGGHDDGGGSFSGW